MGLLSGSASISRFAPARGPSAGPPERFGERITRFAFRTFTDDSVQETALGWVAATDPFRTELTEADWRRGDLLVLGLRVDKRAVPPRLLKHRAALEERKVRAETGVDRLNQRARKELQERTRQRLIRRMLPSVDAYDMVWDTRQGRVLLTSTAERVCELFARHFEATFGIRLKRLYAYAHFERTAPEGAGLGAISPARFS